MNYLVDVGDTGARGQLWTFVGCEDNPLKFKVDVAMKAKVWSQDNLGYEPEMAEDHMALVFKSETDAILFKIAHSYLWVVYD